MQTNQPIDQHEGLLTEFVGHEVLDEHGLHLGRVADIVDIPQDGPAELLVVDPGPLRPAHYVPISGSYHTNNGQIVLPWDKHWVKTAPRVSGDHVPTATQLAELKTHYSII